MKIAVSLRNELWLVLLVTGCLGAFAAENADLTIKGVIRLPRVRLICPATATSISARSPPAR